MKPLNINVVRNWQGPQIAKYTKIGDELGYDLMLSKSKHLKISVPAKIEYQGPCVGVTFVSSTEKEMAHIAPELTVVPAYMSPSNYGYQNKNRETPFDRQIERIVEKFREGFSKSYDGLVALITGGIACSDTELSQNSSNIVSWLFECLNKNNKIPTTVIACQKNENWAKNRVNTYVKNSNAYIYNGAVNDIKIPENKIITNPTDILETAFDFVEIAPEMNVIIK